MKVVIIGAGNVGTVLGRLIVKAGHEVIQVISRDASNARWLAGQLGCAHFATAGGIDHSGEIYLVAMPDAALNKIHGVYTLGDKLVVHTAGAISKDILKPVSSRYGIIYPLQSLRKENPELQQEIPILIDGNAEEIIKTIESFALTISSKVKRSTDEERLKLHVAAVLVSNFTNHLYKLASDYCIVERVDFKMLQPLIEETALRMRNYSPKEMQTGPAARNDAITLDKHVLALSAHPNIKSIYLEITKSIMNS